MPVIDLEDGFLALISHHAFPPGPEREADLQGRLIVVANQNTTSPENRRLLNRYISKELTRDQRPTVNR